MLLCILVKQFYFGLTYPVGLLIHFSLFFKMQDATRLDLNNIKSGFCVLYENLDLTECEPSFSHVVKYCVNVIVR